MLDTILIVDATMIVGVLFVEAFGKALGIKTTWGAGTWMLIWGLVALLPFSISSILGLIGNDLSIWLAGVGFVGFTAWFLIISSIAAKSIHESEVCQKIVEENELAKYLAQGWVVVVVLQSGKVIIE